MSEKRGDTTVRISEERKLTLMRRVLEIGNKTGYVPRMGEIVIYLIDNYLDDAVKDIIDKKNNGKKWR